MSQEKENSPEDIKVFIRILPTTKMCFDKIKISKNRKLIYAQCLQKNYLLEKQECSSNYWCFREDGVFYNENQDYVYENVMKGVLNSVAGGKNAVILSYGQTGTGKSLTSSGLNYTFEDRGIAPRIISDLYALKQKMSRDTHIKIKISYVEIMKDSAIDLLKAECNKLDTHSLKSINIAKPKNEFEALTLLFQAEGRRCVAENTPHNAHLAHGVLTIHLTTTPCFISNAQRKRSKIYVVDLAGADSLGNPTSMWKNVTDVVNGNLTKTLLEQFLLVLSEKIPEAIYCKRRLNILILYISDALMFSNVIRVIGHIRIDKENLATTISMLRFSQLIKGLPMFVHADKVGEFAGNKGDSDLIQQLCSRELKTLKIEKDLNSMIMNTDLSTNITQDREQLVEQMTNKYLSDEFSEIVLLNITDINTAMRSLKEKHNGMKKDIAENNKIIYAKAYQDVLEKIKSTGSRMSNIIPVGSTSKTLQRKNKLDDDQLSTSSAKRKSSKNFGKGKKPSVMSTISEKTKVSKKSGSVSSTINTRPNTRSKEKTSQEIGKELEIIPESLPGREEAWSNYIKDDQFHYKQLEEIKTNLETQFVEFKKEYLKELDILKQLTARHITKMDDLSKFKMNMNFAQWKIYNAKEKNEELENSIRDLECDISNQRERILKAQTELRITLEQIVKTKSKIVENYEEYCKLMYQLPLAVSESEVNITNEPIEEIETMVDELSLVSSKYNELIRYQVLKTEMNKQMMIKRRRLQKKKQWIKYF